MCWSSHGRCSQKCYLSSLCSFSFIHLSPFLLTISRRIVEARFPADGHVLVWSSLYFWYSFSTGNFLRRFLWMTLASGLAATTLTRRRGSSGGGIIVVASMETIRSLDPIARETAHDCVSNMYSKHETNRLKDRTSPQESFHYKSTLSTCHVCGKFNAVFFSPWKAQSKLPMS